MNHLTALFAIPLALLCTPHTGGADAAKADLARRLDLPASEIQLMKEQPVTWTDGALGLPQPGKVYTKALVAGTLVELNARGTHYIYTTADEVIRFGGPVVEGVSLLYLDPDTGDANLNGNLVHVSLVGCNPRVLIAGVSDFVACANGGILATRRTSRSGFELLYLAPGGVEAVKLGGAFAFGTCGMDEKGTRWAALQRFMLGAGWSVMLGEVGKVETTVVDLPAGQPKRLVWIDEKLFVQMADGWLRLDGEWQKTSAPFVAADRQMVLSKSQTLVAETEQVEGKPVAKIYKEWFTGQKDDVASVAGLVVKTRELIAGRWLLLSGEQDGVDVAVVVDIANGMVMPALEGGFRGVRGVLRAPEKMTMIRQ